MRCWWLIAFACACGKADRDKPSVKPAAKPTDAAIADAMPPPGDGEVAVPAGGGVGAFYLDRTEATIGDYQRCVAAHACSRTEDGIEARGDAKVAIGGLTFDQARAYCTWRGKRLPTPAEWRRAAYGDDARKYPWGNEPPTCERAYFKDCKGDGPTAPGRPAGASAFGALDMLGNVDEYTDSGPLAFPRACVDKPRTSTLVFGGEFGSPSDSPTFDRDNVVAEHPTWTTNRDLGVRCARGGTPRDPVSTDPILTADTWMIERMARASDAYERVAERCKAGEQATVIAGELVGQTGWVVAGKDGKPVPAPKGLVRVVGVATCDMADTTQLTVKAGTRTWRLDIPSAVGVYQMWLAPGTWATFSIDCAWPKSKGECSFARVLAPPATFLVPAGPASGVEGPALEGTGGMTCD